MVMELRKAERSKSQRESKVKLVTRWDYTQECSPAFARLMALLLRPREANTSKEEKEAENER